MNRCKSIPSANKVTPQGTKWQDWRERKGELFRAVRMEKNMMGLLLSSSRRSAFNIITSLGLMVMEKQGEVILQTWQADAATNYDGLAVQGAMLDYRRAPAPRWAHCLPAN